MDPAVGLGAGRYEMPKRQGVQRATKQERKKGEGSARQVTSTSSVTKLNIGTLAVFHVFFVF